MFLLKTFALYLGQTFCSPAGREVSTLLPLTMASLYSWHFLYDVGLCTLSAPRLFPSFQQS